MSNNLLKILRIGDFTQKPTVSNQRFDIRFPGKTNKKHSRLSKKIKSVVLGFYNTRGAQATSKHMNDGSANAKAKTQINRQTTS